MLKFLESATQIENQTIVSLAMVGSVILIGTLAWNTYKFAESWTSFSSSQNTPENNVSSQITENITQVIENNTTQNISNIETIPETIPEIMPEYSEEKILEMIRFIAESIINDFKDEGHITVDTPVYSKIAYEVIKLYENNPINLNRALELANNTISNPAFTLIKSLDESVGFVPLDTESDLIDPIYYKIREIFNIDSNNSAIIVKEVFHYINLLDHYRTLKAIVDHHATIKRVRASYEHIMQNVFGISNNQSNDQSSVTSINPLSSQSEKVDLISAANNAGACPNPQNPDWWFWLIEQFSNSYDFIFNYCKSIWEFIFG